VSQLKKLLVALTPMGAAAYVAGGGTFASVGELVRWAEHPTVKPVVARSKNTTGDPLWRAKKTLLLLMAIGAAAYFGFGGTFANFQAETSNGGSSISSGTLVMSNQVNSNANACFSYNAPTVDNINSGCDAPFAVTNVAPGTFNSTQVAKVVVTNTGSIDGSHLYVYASQVNGRLATGITSGQTNIASLTLTSTNPGGLEGTVATGNSIVVSYGGHSQTFSASAPAIGGATSISVSPATAQFDFPAGSTVTNASGNTSTSNTNCYDTKTSNGGTPGATAGNVLNFNPIAGNPLCGSVLMWVQEVAGANTYCWFGKGSAWSAGSTPTLTEDPNGRCVAPISVTTSGLPVNANTTSIPVSSSGGLNGNVRFNDTILVAQGTHTQTFVASQPATFGATSISVNSASVGTAFTSGAIVTDTAAQVALDSNAGTDNISAFQTAHRLTAGKIELFPVSNNGQIDQTSGAPELAHAGASNSARTFYIGLYLPVPGGSNQNPLQGLASTFGLTWHLDQ
jgi:hypothetical protein